MADSLTPFRVIPNPRSCRTWTRQEWKQKHRMCRILTKRITPEMIEKTEQACRNALIYGISNPEVLDHG